MTKDQIRGRIEEVGLIPSLRVSSAEEASFVAETVAACGIPIVEITMTVPGAIDVIAALARDHPDLIVGAGTLMDTDIAHRCIQSGARFLTTTGLDLEIIAVAKRENVLSIPGVLTPGELMAAWRAGGDLIKVFPCAQVGGAAYIRALKAPFPQIPLIASGGVNQQTAVEFILAGAVALGVGGALVPREAIESRRPDRIRELARRFIGMVRSAREQKANHW
ncbi:MAG: bifunctional 4-hydroxy-2-oxoglutarate aldolase/2-dehydro-3-deoxy-phosphogluconate aldolase [Bryobacteraceae bacterium]|jgi:2-dehydro-3-deoxyphosphogluconate aldolase/(4S)-4-hydroxy-2-oxoglutarate aldolase